MHLLFHHSQVRPSARIERLVAARLRGLAPRVRVAAAEVRLSAVTSAEPRFRASVLLRIPGPDLHAAACDHTSFGAVAAALDALETQLGARASRRRARRHLISANTVRLLA